MLCIYFSKARLRLDFWANAEHLNKIIYSLAINFIVQNDIRALKLNWEFKNYK